MEKTKISVILPVYNVEKYLEESVDSILAQTFTDFELICVDDGATDSSGEILDWYSRRDPRVRVIHQQNQHLGIARNNGLKVASGKYVIFLDSDDFFNKNMLAGLYEKAESCDAQITICNVDQYDDSTGRFNEANFYLRLWNIPEKEPFSWRDAGDRLYVMTTPTTWNLFYRRDFLLESGIVFPDYPMIEDLPHTDKLLSRAERMATVNKKYVHYRINRPGNLGTRYRHDPMFAFGILKEIKADLVEQGKFQELRNAFAAQAMSTTLFMVSKADIEEGFRRLISYIRTDGSREFELERSQGLIADSIWKEYCHLMDTDMETLVAERFVHPEPRLVVLDDRSPAAATAVSLVIPAYNSEPFLRQCLDSVVTQLDEELELICVDDGSVDGTLNIFREYWERDKRFVVVSTDNAGLSAARNLGLTYARGSYVLFLDSDDMLIPGALPKLLQKAQTDDLDILVYNAEVALLGDDPGLQAQAEKFTNYYRRNGTYRGITSGAEFLFKLEHRNEYLPAVGRFFYRRSFLTANDLTFFKGMIHEDQLYSVEAMVKARRCAYIPDKLYIRTIREGSIMTSEVSEKNFIGYFIAYSRLMTLYRQSQDSLEQPLSLAIESRAKHMLKIARRIYTGLSAKQRISIKLPPDLTIQADYDVFLMLANEYDKLLKKQTASDKRIKNLKKENKKFKKELDMRLYDRIRRKVRRGFR
jgi:glycosyltransferase involved in cell wall biosynthesis